MGLDACARLEGWRLKLALADHLDIDEWRVDAARSAGAVIAASGQHRDVTTAWVDAMFSRPAPS